MGCALIDSKNKKKPDFLLVQQLNDECFKLTTTDDNAAGELHVHLSFIKPDVCFLKRTSFMIENYNRQTKGWSLKTTTCLK